MRAGNPGGPQHDQQRTEVGRREDNVRGVGRARRTTAGKRKVWCATSARGSADKEGTPSGEPVHLAHLAKGEKVIYTDPEHPTEEVSAREAVQEMIKFRGDCEKEPKRAAALDALVALAVKE